MSNPVSYTSASVQIPTKVLHDTSLVESIILDKHIYLRHLQLCLTNRCNLNCSLCSCSDRDKTLELSFERIMSILLDASKAGCKSITITGGGEPLLHPEINEIRDFCYGLGIKVGLVSNGLLLGRLKRMVNWCRVSFDSLRTFSDLEPTLAKAVKTFPSIDWAISYVLYEKLGDLKKAVEFANNHNFTHIRVVSDINNPDDNMMLEAKKLLEGIDSKVIYQPRGAYTKGAEKCWISLLKPTIAASGDIFPCCGAQYSINGQSKDFSERMSMGNDLKDICENQRVFNGSICDKCYYSGYNQLLDIMMKDINHKEWV